MMPKTQKAAISVPAKTDVQSAPLAWIDIPENRARSFDPDEAAGLASVIAEVGLLHPIRVRAVGNRYSLVSGRKRLEACRLLGWSAIPVTISNATTDDAARLEEVIENLAGFDLNKLDRCQHLYELKQVYERLYPEAKNGGDRGNQHTGGRIRNPDSASEGTEIFGFVEKTAQKIGLSRSVIAEGVKIWTELAPESRKRLAGTWMANRQSALKEISEQTPVDQAKLLNLLLSEPPAAQTVTDALAILQNGSAMTPAEKKIATVNRALQSLAKPVAESLSAAADAARLADLKEGIATLSKYLGKLEDAELDSVIVAHEERIIASLKRRGRI